MKLLIIAEQQLVASRKLFIQIITRYRKDFSTLTCDTCCMEAVGEKRNDSEERLRHFYTAFGQGEFPFITVTVIRIGNKDHYFYTIHR